MSRPILAIPKTKIEIFHEVISIIVLASSIIYVCLEWSKLPSMIPEHFNGSGEETDGVVKHLY